MSTGTMSPEDALAEVGRTTFHLLIGGEACEAAGGRRTPTVDPSTGQEVSSVPEAGPADVERAVQAALGAQPGWAATDLADRVRCVERFAELLAGQAERIARIESVDTGNPLASTRRDMRIAAEHLHDWPAYAATLAGSVQRGPGPTLHYTTHHPYGVVGRITAFNHPSLFAVNGAVMPLLAGNTAVLKPSPMTPLGTLALAELFAEAFPPGVVNLLTGDAEVGDALVTHPRVKRLGFIGSTAVGLKIQERAAQSGTVKHVSLELGGKNALVVLPDVDVAAVVEATVSGMSLEVSQGQSCQATSRVFVHRAIEDDYVGMLAERLRGYTIGRAYDPAVEVGPLVSARQVERVADYVAIGRAEGATLVAGGGRPADVPEGGFYFDPTLFVQATADMRIATEEIFGPVVTVVPWDDYESMLAQVNGSPYGLAASVWTRDISLAVETAHRLEAGYVWV
ncbi:MAG TPA: aldehyde dehydrogenase family protein, partial [Acidimicrobiales bacterium]|nr:aldehyde dehydrogenase family protein [Acidimicrobiales bacterium]